MLSNNFSRSEFRCKCGCGFDTPDDKLVKLLEEIRTQAGNKPIYINSACRCVIHNKNVGGSNTSQHILGKAADIRCNHKTPDELSYIANEILGLTGGVGVYNTFCHVDVRDTMARWS